MRTPTITALVAFAGAAIAAPTFAQDVGTTIVGNDDAAVGTVISNDGTTVLVDTGTHEVPLGPEAFAEADGVWSINTTKADLDVMMADLRAQQEAALSAALIEGAAVITADAQPLGTIDTIEEEAIVLTYQEEPLTLPKNLFALDADGAVMVLANHEAIIAAVEAAQS